MAIKLNNDKTLTIQSFSLRDFVFDIAKASKAGYSPVDDNDKYPQGFVNHHWAVFVSDNDLTDAQRKALGLEVEAKEENTETKDQTSTETALNDDSNPVEAKVDTNVPEVKETAKTATKTASRSTKK